MPLRRGHLSNGIERKDIPGLIWTLLAVCFVFCMVHRPVLVFQGAIAGLKAWWEIVFPSLLPFFITSEILMRLGLVRFIGTLLEPVMRPIFNVPGTGGFVMVIGFTSGFPIGGMVTAQLRRDGLCSKTEGERLMSFTNNSSPLFMLTAVAVGMFGRPEFGVLIAGSHYLANLLLGIGLRFYKRHDREGMSHNSSNQNRSVIAAINALIEHQRKERIPLGKLLGEAVASSVTKLLNIGGFIILFAVIIRIMQDVGAIQAIASVLGLILAPLGFPPDILKALASGMFEMTMGTKLASEASGSQLDKLMAVAMILGWSGLCIQAQVASMISGTDMNMKIFVLTRVAHAFLAAVLLKFLYSNERIACALLTTPVFSPLLHAAHGSTFKMVYGAFCTMGMLLGLLIALALVYRIIVHSLRAVLRLF